MVTNFAYDYFTSTAQSLPRGASYDAHVCSQLVDENKLIKMIDTATRYACAFRFCSERDMHALALSTVARVADFEKVERPWQTDRKPISRKLTYAEAGEAMGISARAYRSLLSKARDHLRLGIEEQLNAGKANRINRLDNCDV